MARDHYYQHQQFMMNLDFDKISLSEYQAKPLDDDYIQDYRIEHNLFDHDEHISRSISFEYLLEKIDTEDDWHVLISQLIGIDKIWIINDMTKEENPIISNYLQDSMKSIIQRIEAIGFEVRIYTQ